MPITEKEALGFIEAYENDAAAFQMDILGRSLWSTQVDICHAISRPHAQVAVAACHGSGKTFLAGGLVLWWVAMGGICVTTAPSGGQVKRLLWGEVHAAYKRSRVPIGGTLNLTELRMGPDNYAVGFSTDETVNFQGFHGKVLIIMDEATGIDAGIWTAVQGIRSGGDVRVLALCNPTDTSGEVYKCFTSKRDLWTCFHIDALDTPNALAARRRLRPRRDDPSCPPLTADQLESVIPSLDDDALDVVVNPHLPTLRWIKESIVEWGIGTPAYRARVRGQFSEESSSALIPLSALHAASLRVYPPQELVGDLVAGLDVAGEGDDFTVLTVRRGPQIIYQNRWQGGDEEDVRYDVANDLEQWRMENIRVQVDSIGVGYNMAQYLRNDAMYEVVFVNVGERSSDPERFYNKKAEYYWWLRDRFLQGSIAGITDEETMAQLSQIHYEERGRQIKIESKADARKRRGIKSPDKAESVMLCYAQTELEGFLWVSPQAAAGGWNKGRRAHVAPGL